MKYLLVFALVIFYSTLVSQKLFFQAGYYGDYVINPGVNIGLGYPVIEYSSKQLFSKKKTKKQIIPFSSISLYWDPFSHTGVSAQANIMYLRETKSANIKRYFIVGYGALRTILPETYLYDTQGNIKKKQFGGYTYWFPSISIFGHQTVLNSKNELYFHPTLNLLLKYNGFILPSIKLEFGLRFNS